MIDVDSAPTQGCGRHSMRGFLPFLLFAAATYHRIAANRRTHPRLMELTAGGMSTSSAVKMASKDLNLKKSDVYRVALRLQPSGTDTDG